MVSTPVTTVAYGQQQSHREIYAVAYRHCVIEVKSELFLLW